MKPARVLFCSDLSFSFLKQEKGCHVPQASLYYVANDLGLPIILSFPGADTTGGTCSVGEHIQGFTLGKWSLWVAFSLNQ